MARDWPHLDWIACAYRPAVHIGVCRAGVVHSLHGGTVCSQRSGMLDALERRIKEGDAAWAVELRCRETLMCRVETSRDARQEVVWDGRDIAGDVLVTPGVLAVREFPLRREAGTLSGEPKRAMPRTVPAGLWLARGKSGRAKPLAGHLLAFRRAPELERGGIAVAPDRTNGYLRFTVRLAPDVFRHAGSDPSLRTAALVAVCSRFPQAFGRWGPENGEPALARELRSLVAARGNGVALWDEEDYDPARMATALEPLRLPDRSPFPLADGVLLARTRPVFDRWQKDMIFEVALHGQWEAADPQVKALVRRRQQELRSAVDGGYRALGSYLRRKLQIGRYETIGAPPFPRAELAPAEFLQLSAELETELAEAWLGPVGPGLASQPLFWTLCHLEWLEEGRFGVTGKRLHEAFLLGGGGSGRPRERETRNFLRRTGGLHAARGARSVFSDCPLARAWWRHRLAEEVERAGSWRTPRATASHVFGADNQAWEQLATSSLRARTWHSTCINQPRVRAAIVKRLAERFEQTGSIGRKDVLEIVQAFDRQDGWWSYEQVPWDEMPRG